MKDTRAERDLPVLEAVVTALEDAIRVNAAEVAAATGIPADDVVRAFYALQWTYTGQVQTRLGGGPNAFLIDEVTGDARRAVGRWPTAEGFAERLADGLAQAADSETDADSKSRLRAVSRELGGAAEAVAANIASTYLEHRLPH